LGILQRKLSTLFRCFYAHTIFHTQFYFYTHFCYLEQGWLRAPKKEARGEWEIVLNSNPLHCHIWHYMVHNVSNIRLSYFLYEFWKKNIHHSNNSVPLEYRLYSPVLTQYILFSSTTQVLSEQLSTSHDLNNFVSPNCSSDSCTKCSIRGNSTNTWNLLCYYELNVFERKKVKVKQTKHDRVHSVWSLQLLIYSDYKVFLVWGLYNSL